VVTGIVVSGLTTDHWRAAIHRCVSHPDRAVGIDGTEIDKSTFSPVGCVTLEGAVVCARNEELLQQKKLRRAITGSDKAANASQSVGACLHCRKRERRAVRGGHPRRPLGVRVSGKERHALQIWTAHAWARDEAAAHRDPTSVEEKIDELVNREPAIAIRVRRNEICHHRLHRLRWHGLALGRH